MWLCLRFFFILRRENSETQTANQIYCNVLQQTSVLTLCILCVEGKKYIRQSMFLFMSLRSTLIYCNTCLFFYELYSYKHACFFNIAAKLLSSMSKKITYIYACIDVYVIMCFYKKGRIMQLS